MAIKQLYLKVGDKVRGPFQVSQVREAARQGKVLPAHEASADGQNWFRLETIWTQLVAVPIAAPKSAPSAAQPLSASTPARPLAPSQAHAAPADRTAPPRMPAPASVRPAGAPLAAPALPAAIPVDSAAMPEPYAPQYSTNIQSILRMLLLLAGLIYAAVCLNQGFIFLGVMEVIPGMHPSGMMRMFETQGMLVAVALLADMGVGIVLLVWLSNAYARLRAFHPEFLSDSFSTWAITYYFPVVTVFRFADISAKVLNAAQAGKSDSGLRKATPDAVLLTTALRGVVWATYFCAVLSYWWLASQQHSREGAKTAGIIFFVAILVGAAVSAAVMFLHYAYVGTVHRDMLAMQDPE